MGDGVSEDLTNDMLLSLFEEEIDFHCDEEE